MDRMQEGFYPRACQISLKLLTKALLIREFFHANKNGGLDIKGRHSGKTCLRSDDQLFLLQERQQILIEAILMRVRQTMRGAGLTSPSLQVGEERSTARHT
jgi:hypothetical protein